MIGYKAFQWCVNLKKVEIPNSVWKIGAYAFYNCYNAEIILKKPESKFKIGGNAFWSCKIVVDYVNEKTRT